MSSNAPAFPDFSVSHVGLFVFDLDAMVDFYTGTFGLAITDRSVVRGDSRIAFLSRDPREHHQIVLIEGRTAPLDTQLLNQISLRLTDLAALRRVEAILEADPRVSDIKPSNHGNAFSIYFRDPECNRFEVFVDSPFYVEQAVIDPLALDQSDDELIDQTRAAYCDRPSFKPIEQWRAEFARKLDR